MKLLPVHIASGVRDDALSVFEASRHTSGAIQVASTTVEGTPSAESLRVIPDYLVR